MATKIAGNGMAVRFVLPPILYLVPDQVFVTLFLFSVVLFQAPPNVAYGGDPLMTALRKPVDTIVAKHFDRLVYLDYSDKSIAYVDSTTGDLLEYALSLTKNPRKVEEVFPGLGVVILHATYSLYAFNIDDPTDMTMVRLAGTDTGPLVDNSLLVDVPAGTVSLGEVNGIDVDEDTGVIYMIEKESTVSIKELTWASPTLNAGAFTIAGNIGGFSTGVTNAITITGAGLSLNDVVTVAVVTDPCAGGTINSSHVVSVNVAEIHFYGRRLTIEVVLDSSTPLGTQFKMCVVAAKRSTDLTGPIITVGMNAAHRFFFVNFL